MSTTSGREAPRQPDGRLAVRGLGDDLMSGCASRIIRKPARTSAWSSATSTRRVGAPAADRPRPRASGALAGTSCVAARRQPGPDGVAAAEPGTDLDPSAGQRRPLAHPDQAASGAVAVRGRLRAAPAGAVVEDLDPELVGLLREVDHGPGTVRVAERVRQRLLDDPVGGHVDARRERSPVAGRSRARRAGRRSQPARPARRAGPRRAAARARPPSAGPALPSRRAAVRARVPLLLVDLRQGADEPRSSLIAARPVDSIARSASSPGSARSVEPAGRPRPGSPSR